MPTQLLLLLLLFASNRRELRRKEIRLAPVVSNVQAAAIIAPAILQSHPNDQLHPSSAASSPIPHLSRNLPLTHVPIRDSLGEMPLLCTRQLGADGAHKVVGWGHGVEWCRLWARVLA